MGHRIVGVIFAIAIVFSLEWFWRVEWYIAVPLSVVGYLIVRYAAYFRKERGAQ
jgi:cytosine/uracil/thiamine/allantoin permease